MLSDVGFRGPRKSTLSLTPVSKHLAINHQLLRSWRENSFTEDYNLKGVAKERWQVGWGRGKQGSGVIQGFDIGFSFVNHKILPILGSKELGFEWSKGG